MRRFPEMIFILILFLTFTPFAHAEDRFFDSAGVQIRYVERGQGEPVVLIHGFSRNVEINWIEPGILDALADNYHVIALDCRGHGKSDKPDGDEAYGLNMVEDVIRLLDHLNIDQAQVIGYSMGSRMALKLAAMYPDRVRSVVLVAGGGARQGDDHGLWDSVAESLERGDGIRPLILKIWPQGQPTEEQIQAINEQVLAANDAQALASVARRYREFATSADEIKAIDIPMLAIIGSDDAFRSNVNALKIMMPDLTVIVVEGAGHVSVLEKPEFQEAVEAFLSIKWRLNPGAGLMRLS